MTKNMLKLYGRFRKKRIDVSHVMHMHVRIFVCCILYLFHIDMLIFRNTMDGYGYDYDYGWVRIDIIYRIEQKNETIRILDSGFWNRID